MNIIFSLLKVFVLIIILFNNINIYASFPLTYINNSNNVPSLSSMINKVLPAVVNMHIEGTQIVRQSILPKEFRYFFGPNIPNNNSIRQFEGLGSGVIIDANNGYIITNNHVIHNADKIKIQLHDGREFYAKLVGCDDKTDLALLKISNPSNLIEIKIADSDNLKVGDFVIAIGNPFGLGQTVTSGIVSALSRSGLNLEGLENFIQTDASINRGNSGGALINLNGELVGINTAILAPNGGNIGIGFAIPSNIVKSLSEQLIKYGEIRRGQLGIKGTELTADIANALQINAQHGAFVSEVMVNSAAYKAGIKAGDIIISINGRKIKSFAELRVKISITNPGDTITIGILRDNKISNISVTLEDSNIKYINDSTEEIISIPILQGALLSNNYKVKGVLVNSVVKNSPAFSIGLQQNDIIVGVNKEDVSNITQLKKILNKKLNIIVFHIIRGKTNMFLLVN
ncbi:MAG: Do family serine endopeptidase [Candidatus Lightella neohaematopini]|nr:Do family serine endopeptidase [Candidatus Lightella neohaematopini]MCV2531082.1 Do family serine endopeptidase [Candidatus Lightella neohaematopini]